MIPTGSRKIVVNISSGAISAIARRASQRVGDAESTYYGDHVIYHGRVHPESLVATTPEEHRLAALRHDHATRSHNQVDFSDEGHKGAEEIETLHKLAAAAHIRAYEAKTPTSNAIGFDGKHWPGRGEAEEDEDEYRTPAKLFK